MQDNKQAHNTQVIYLVRYKLIWVLIIVGILVAKWVIRRIFGVELIVIGIHFTNQRLKLQKKG